MSHQISHRNPRLPMRTKDQRQPMYFVNMPTVIGVRIAPALVPELNMPKASARSFFGNHSATALLLAGKTPDSPSPSEERAKIKLSSDRQAPVAIEARLQTTITSEYPLRVPSRSTTLPITSKPTA